MRIDRYTLSHSWPSRLRRRWVGEGHPSAPNGDNHSNALGTGSLAAVVFAAPREPSVAAGLDRYRRVKSTTF